MKSLKQYKMEQMKNPDFRKEYESLEAEFKEINSKIDDEKIVKFDSEKVKNTISNVNVTKIGAWA